MPKEAFSNHDFSMTGIAWYRVVVCWSTLCWLFADMMREHNRVLPTVPQNASVYTVDRREFHQMQRMFGFLPFILV